MSLPYQNLFRDAVEEIVISKKQSLISEIVLTYLDLGSIPVIYMKDKGARTSYREATMNPWDFLDNPNVSTRKLESLQKSLEALREDFTLMISDDLSEIMPIPTSPVPLTAQQLNRFRYGHKGTIGVRDRGIIVNADDTEESLKLDEVDESKDKFEYGNGYVVEQKD